jgi:hypothetical protein
MVQYSVQCIHLYIPVPNTSNIPKAKRINQLISPHSGSLLLRLRLCHSLRYSLSLRFSHRFGLSLCLGSGHSHDPRRNRHNGQMGITRISIGDSRRNRSRRHVCSCDL